DERHWARMAVTRYHQEIEITPQDFIDHFDDFARCLEPPFQGMGAFGQYMVGKAISDHGGIDVVLSGEGADELFGGYARQMIVAGEKPPVGYENYQLPEGSPPDLKEGLDYDYAHLPDLLAVDDQCMNAHGLEARAPFTNPSVVEFALALPIRDRVGKRY